MPYCTRENGGKSSGKDHPLNGALIVILYGHPTEKFRLAI